MKSTTRTRFARSAAGIALAVSALLVAMPSSATADTVVRTIPVATGPAVLATTPDGSTVVVFDGANQLSVIDVASGAQTTPVTLGAAAYNIAISPDGATAVVPATYGGLWFVQTATGEVIGTSSLGYVFDVAFSPDGTQVYVTTGSTVVNVVDVATHAVVRSITAPFGAYGIALSADGANLLLTSPFPSLLAVSDAATGATLNQIAVASLPTDVIVSPDGTRAYLTSLVTGAVESVELGVGTATIVNVGGAGPVSGAAIAPDGTSLYLARGFDNMVSVVDTTTNTALAPVNTGVNTQGVAIAADGATVFTGDAELNNLLVIAVDRPPLLAAAAPAATVGAAYTFTPLASGSPAPTYTLTGALPAGLSFDAGVISGTPTAAGSSSFTITATNGLGSDTQAYTLTVSAAATLAATGVAPLPLAASAGMLVLLGLALRRPRRVH